MAGNFVGRQEFFRRIPPVNVEPGRPSRMFVVPGSPGSGKTELLRQLRHAAQKQERGPAVTVIDIRCGQYGGLGGRHDARPLDEAAEFQQFEALILDALPPRDGAFPDDTRDWAAAEPSLSGSPRDNSPGSPASGGPGQLIKLATEAANSLLLNGAGHHEYVLVLVDDFDQVAWRPLGDWLLSWLVGIRGADVVVTTMPASDEQASPWPAQAITMPLGSLGRDDVQRYLAASDGIGPGAAAKTVAPVWEFTGGNPQAMVLVADLIRESILKDGQPEGAVETIRQLGALQGDLIDQLDELDERFFSAIGDEELRHALYTLCVTRSFNRDLLMRLLDVDQVHANAIIDRMRRFSFVTEADGFHAITPYIRQLGEKRLGDAARRNEIHETAAEYFLDLINEDIDAHQSWRGGWGLLEDASFQGLKKEWLYHVSRLTGLGRRTGRLDIARLFLDGFWWWGCYAPFPFCEEILADWMSVTADDSRASREEKKKDRDWGLALRSIYDTYPRGNRLERANRSALITVRANLRLLWDRGGLGDRDDSAEVVHLRGIVSAFLTDIMRYINPADPRVDEALADARSAFLADEDEYSAAWTDFQRSELDIQRGQWEQAMSLARHGAQRHARFKDGEIIANFHRVYADALWSTGEAGPALDGYARAVLHAYAAQVQDVGSPDPYTNAFQQEMIDRCLERMADLLASAVRDDTALATLTSACARIRAFFCDYWEAVGHDPAADVAADVVGNLAGGRYLEAAGLLFPALAPDIGIDLIRGETGWEQTCHDVRGEMRAELAALPGIPLPQSP
jgi:hypothetical protein